jgi:hypothetical protein
VPGQKPGKSPVVDLVHLHIGKIYKDNDQGLDIARKIKLLEYKVRTLIKKEGMWSWHEKSRKHHDDSMHDHNIVDRKKMNMKFACQWRLSWKFILIKNIQREVEVQANSCYGRNGIHRVLIVMQG